MPVSLEALRRFDASHRGPGTLSDVGLLLLDPLEEPWGEDTPSNSLVFGHTGGDSVHFCLLDLGGGVSEGSPVVMVVPCNSECARTIVGESLHEFLALGSVTGFSSLEDLTYHPEEALRCLFDWEAYVRRSYFGQPPPAEDRAFLSASRELLRELSAEFALAPWPDVERRLAQLAATWSPRVRLSPG